MDFEEKFNTYSNTDLLKIIDSPGDYQPQAVEVAKNIFASRQLNENEIEIAKAELAIQLQEKEKKKDIENKVKKIGISLLDNINPIQTKKPSTDKQINAISIIFGGLFLIQLYRKFGLISFMFTDSDAKWDFIIVIDFLTLLIVPTASFLFFKRKKIGWTLFSIYLVYSVISSIGLFFMIINIEPIGFKSVDNFFPHIFPVFLILTILFFCGILWIICKEKIREIYLVDKKYMIAIIGIVAILSIVMTCGIYF